MATTTNKRLFIENQDVIWEDIKNDVVKLEFNNNGQIISLPTGMSEYIQAKTASADLGSKKVEIESRYLAFKLGNNIVRIRVDEKTNNISVEVE